MPTKDVIVGFGCFSAAHLTPKVLNRFKVLSKEDIKRKKELSFPQNTTIFPRLKPHSNKCLSKFIGWANRFKACRK